MLGCIATAPNIGQASPPTQDSGFYGGNIDFNEIADGATLYLPVANPGALLYFGDGHALQGDGELNGNALETSMDVELTVDVSPGRPIAVPASKPPTPSSPWASPAPSTTPSNKPPSTWPAGSKPTTT